MSLTDLVRRLVWGRTRAESLELARRESAARERSFRDRYPHGVLTEQEGGVPNDAIGYDQANHVYPDPRNRVAAAFAYGYRRGLRDAEEGK